MTLTKRDLVIRITSDMEAEQPPPDPAEAARKPANGRRKAPKVTQQQVFGVVQKTLDYIAEELAKGNKVELRNFGVFQIRTRKARVGRNPNAPEANVPIPARSVVKFKAGKELRAAVLKLRQQPVTPPATPPQAPAPPKP